MAGKSDTTEGAVLDLIYLATAWANYADNAASSPQTNIQIAAHTADPGDSGTMSTSEATYTSYARGTIARSGSGFTRTGNSVSPNALFSFAAATGGTNTLTHFSTGKTGGGAAAILHAGTITPNITATSGVTPQLTTATAITED
jgi:hypothetical protein